MWSGADPVPQASGATAGAPSRRRALGWLAGAALGAAGRVDAATPPLGVVLPRLPAPDLRLVDGAGKPVAWRALLRGRVTAVQLMFAGCSSTCPIQGATFAAVAQRLTSRDAQLLSLTIDPLGDSPAALRAWLGRFGPHPCWTAGAPRLQDVDTLAEFLRGAPATAGTHTSQVYLMDRQARLAFRSIELPSAPHIAELLTALAEA